MKLKVALTSIDVHNAIRYAKESSSTWIMYFPLSIPPKDSKDSIPSSPGCIVIKTASKFSVHPVILEKPKKKTKNVAKLKRGRKHD